MSGQGESNPTVVNNVETLMSVAHIMANGVDWFRSMGTEASPGTIVAAESCGQCPPCKQGSLSITARLGALLRGEAGDEILGSLAALLRSVTDSNRCFLGTEEQIVVSSILREFSEDVTELLEHRPAVLRVIEVPLIKDITASGMVEYERHLVENG